MQKAFKTSVKMCGLSPLASFYFETSTKTTLLFSEQVCDVHDVEWRMLFGLTYLDFCDFLKISIYFLWPLIELVLQLCNEIIQLKFYHYFFKNSDVEGLIVHQASYLSG